MKIKPRQFCIFIVFFFLLTGSGIVGFSHENDPLTKEERAWLIQHDGKIVLGHDPSAKPIDFYDENGEFKGLAADYISLLEKKLNFKFKLSKNKTWIEVVEKAKRKEIDVLCTFSKTPDRAEWMDFTEPYIKIPAVILVRNEIEGKLVLDEMQGMKITFPEGWVVEEYLKNNYPQLNLIPSVDEKTAIENVSIGVADAAVTALTSAIVNVEKSKIPNLRVAGETGYFFNLAMASRKDWPVLHSILSKGLSRISQKERDEIYNRWIKFSSPSILENKTFIYSVLASIVGIIFVIALVIIWNRTLQNEVDHKTIELQKEITERKQAEETMRNTSELLSSFIKYSPIYAFLKEVSQKESRVLYASDNYIDMTGTPSSQMIGKTMVQLFPVEFAEKITIDDIKVVSQGNNFKTDEDLNDRNYITYKFPIIQGDKKYLAGYTVDITERKQAEEQIKASLKEKETLLQEIHHRVKNNMAVISSLLKLQANNIEDEQTKEILKESQSRVYAMSAIHETIHGSENLSEIDLKNYLSKITNSVFQVSSVDPSKVKLKTDIEEMPISISQASPIGLVINELISNSLKYAFPDEREGEINLTMKKLGKELELIVMDDGVGIPANLDWKNSNTLGLKLVRTLVENQLDGSIDMESNNGTKFTIKFNIET